MNPFVCFFYTATREGGPQSRPPQHCHGLGTDIYQLLRRGGMNKPALHLNFSNNRYIHPKRITQLYTFGLFQDRALV